MFKIPDGPPRSLRFAGALVAALLLFCLPAAASGEGSSSDAEETAPTAAQCSAMWGESEADNTCRNESISVEGGLCSISAQCKLPAFVLSAAPVANIETNDGKTEGTDQFFSTSIQTALANVDDLHNCNGELTVGDC